MKRLLVFVLLMMVISIPQVSLAQTGDVCSPVAMQTRINLAITQYESTSPTANTTADALATLSTLQATVNTIVDECQGAVEAEERAALETLYSDLQTGGYIIYVRHTHTDRSNTDTDLSQCETQRNLSDLGRDQAREIYGHYTVVDIPVSRLISTEYCRTHETAILAFGQPEIITRADLTVELVDLFGMQPESGTNWVIVAHIGTLDGAVGLPTTFEEGDALVYRPTENGEFEFYARIALNNWAILAEIASEAD